MVNGRGFRLFMGGDLCKILDVLDNESELKSINLKIREACHSYLLSTDNKQSKKMSNANVVPQGLMDTGMTQTLTNAVTGQSSIIHSDLGAPQGSNHVAYINVDDGGVDNASEGLDSGSESSKPCLHCSDPCRTDSNAIYCDCCEYWIHWTCEGLSEKQGEELGLDLAEYKCVHCLAVESEMGSVMNTQDHSQSINTVETCDKSNDCQMISD